MEENIEKLMEFQHSIMLNAYSAQVLLLAKQWIKELPDDLRKETTLQSAVQHVVKELKEVKELVKQYYS